MWAKAAVKINLHHLSFWSFIQKILNIEVKQFKVGGNSHYEINVFLQFMLATIIGTPSRSYE